MAKKSFVIWFDGRLHSPVHPIPEFFMTTCHKVLQESIKLDPTNIPNSQPNTCIVNFYEEGHTLGFHRDASESKKSIQYVMIIIII